MKRIGMMLPGLMALACVPTLHAELVAGFDMDVSGGMIKEIVSGKSIPVEGHFTPENVAGVSGSALRFDGYTSHVNAALENIFKEGTTKMTVSMWVAVPCYPIIQLDTDTQEETPILTCLDEQKKGGFGFYLGFNGGYSFRTFAGGWPVTLKASGKLTPYEWHNLTAVADCEAGYVKLYDNGVEVASGRLSGTLPVNGLLKMYMGQGTVSRKMGPFELMSYNGLIDDIRIWNEAKDASEIAGMTTTLVPDLDIPASRFSDDKLRPRFHGMPAAGWTNECHGMYHSDGRYHLFFQKNADGPYMARLHWGHISSENLFDWREEKIALAPGDWYDIKGCWSGCVFSDKELTGDAPGIIYTAVNYAKAMIAGASPASVRLEDWTKWSDNPIIASAPEGLSDDFRDPYFFRSGKDAYIIVGTSKGGVGATTLHRYDPASRRWNENGIFFNGTSAATDGVFWEMPNITQMPGGKWLFTATPLSTSQGVRTLYWTGTIDSEGKFCKDTSSARPRLVELNSKQGFGLLSPTIYTHEGKTIVLGIVPDKLTSDINWDLGWAHCYSLPREWTLDASGNLVQKPYEGLREMRSVTRNMKSENFVLSGTRTLEDIKGRAVELLASFEVGSSVFGFNIFKSGSEQGVVKYDPATGVLTADFTALPRLVNDGGVYDGVYNCVLPQRPAEGSEMKLNIFIDHSILDIFVNDTWATSIRVFPTGKEADGIEVFSTGDVNVKSLCAWELQSSGNPDGVSPVAEAHERECDVTDMSGMVIRRNIGSESELNSLPAGIYTVNGKKIMVR